ncbi:MAG: Ppx/GppA family phosphatase [Chlorobiaceae bacterium]|nr:Ppx/GppA family phosphatase [Chlorobiaceae bacterium]
MERTACIDVGTNTALLLVADLDPVTGRIVPVEHRQTIIRLGQSVDEGRVICREAIDRLVACMSEYAELCRSLGVGEVVAAGTSALRDASNRDEVIGEVLRGTGIGLRCISGTEEAELTFFGAVAGMPEVPEPFTVIDIGGGSTEVITGTADAVARSVSIDIGSVRLTERFLTGMPPAPGEFEAAREEIDRLLSANLASFSTPKQEVFGVAGTLTTIAQVCMGEKRFDPEKVQGYRLGKDQVDRLLERLSSMQLHEVVGLGVPEGRADVILMGTLILHRFMLMLGIERVTVSIQGLRFGMAQKKLVELPYFRQTRNTRPPDASLVKKR